MTDAGRGRERAARGEAEPRGGEPRGLGDTVPVLWLCGPPGVGKTTVAWAIYARLARAGAPIGYVDIDQLGICYPASTEDPGRHRAQARNLDTVVAAFHQAGARGVVVSGVVDPAHGPYPELTPRAALTVCRLRAEPKQLTERLVERQGPAAMVAQAVAEAESLETNNIGDVWVDTTNRSVAEVVGLVEQRTTGWLATTGPPRPAPAIDRAARPPGAGGDPVLWLCGATGVGKSTVGFTVYLRTVFGQRVPGAFVDLDQIGFLSPARPDDLARHRVKAGILAGLWSTFQAAGAQCLTIVGPAPDPAAITVYAEALPTATFMVGRLHAGPDELTRRVLTRGAGGSWAQPGDPLKGLSDVELRAVAELAVTQSEVLDRAAVGDLRVDTDGHTVDQIADEVIARTGWPRSDRAGVGDP